ncbi:ankyrin repeat-containing domain protein [Xylaria sp. FL1777]|nr:ankyrin repeat-containing domain protein [Xylaria sp. FL1777]
MYSTKAGLLGNLDHCDFALILEERQRKLTPDTCRWITEEPEFRNWQSEGYILWIFGGPGSGKSFIAYYLYEYLVTEGQIPLHFFFDSKSAGTNINSFKKFYQTIIYQLLQQALRKPEITRKKCFDIARQRLIHGDTSLATLTQAVRDLLSILGSAYLLIDAVDECTGSKKDALDAWLGEIKQLPGVRTVITSRSPQDLQILANNAQCIVLNLPSRIAKSNQDIRLFIEHRLQNSDNPQFSGMGEIAEHVAEKSSGMILYARLMLEILERMPGDEETYKQELNKLPTGLSNLYAERLSRVADDNHSDRDLWGVDAIRKTIERTGSFMIDPKNCLKGLRKETFKYFLRKHCLPLVEILDNSIIRFAHNSVAQFLKGEDIEGAGNTCPERFQIKEIDGHEHSTIISITFLRWNLTQETSASMNYKHLREYAILEWPIHFKRSAQQIMQDEKKRNLILSFCQQGIFRPWMTARAELDVAFRINFALIGGPIYPTPLHIAVYFNIWELVSLFIKDINISDGTQSTPLHIAPGRSSLQIIHLMMKSGANLAAADRNGSLPLHRAVRRGKWETVEELCSRDSTGIDKPDNYKLTPLHIACQFGWTHCVERLVAHSAKVITDDNSDQTPIAVAVENGHFEVVQRLLKSDPALIAHCGRPLVEAARKGSLKTVKFLYEEGVRLESKGNFGQTALHKACIAQNKDLVDYLLSNHIDPDSVDDSERTPLYYAAEKGNLHIVNALIDRDANVNILDRRLETALFKPAGKGHIAVVKRLLEAGTDATILDMWQRTPLRFAAMYGHHEVVLTLFKQTGIKQDIPDWRGRTVLHNAAARLREGQEVVIDILFEYKAAAGKTDKEGMTALHVALSREKGDPPPTAHLIERLIHQKVPINARDAYGRTALYLAVATQHAEAVRLLLEAGAKTDDSSFHEAVRRKDSAIIQALQKKTYYVNLAERDLELPMPLHIAVKKRIWGRSLLHWLAAEGNDLSRVLSDRSTLNMQDVVGRTPLHLAVMSKSLNTMQQLVSAEVEISIADESSFTPLHYAAESQETAILQTIVAARGVEIDKADRWNRTALYIAALRGNAEAVRLLVDAGASFTPDCDRRTPLHVAIDEGHNGATFINERDTFGQTALHLASKNGHFGVVKELLAAGAMSHVLDNNHFLATHFAAEAGHTAIVCALLEAIPGSMNNCLSQWQERQMRSEEISESAVLSALLIEGAFKQVNRDEYLARREFLEPDKRASLTAKVKQDVMIWGWQKYSLPGTILMRATMGGHVDVVRVILEKVPEMPLHAWSYHHHDALQLATGRSNLPIVEELIKAGANVNHSVETHETSLHHAAENGHEAVIALLLQEGANTSTARMKDGATLLHLAAENGHSDVVRQLVRVTFINVTDDMGQTPLHRACLKNHTAAIEVLLDAEANPVAPDMDGKTPLAIMSDLHETLLCLRMQEQATRHRLEEQGR